MDACIQHTHKTRVLKSAQDRCPVFPAAQKGLIERAVGGENTDDHFLSAAGMGGAVHSTCFRLTDLCRDPVFPHQTLN